MNLEIHKPELMQRVNAHIKAGHFHDADDLIEKALDALEEKAHEPATEAGRPRTGADLVAALQTSTRESRTVFDQGLGLFSGPEDSALIDEVVSLAYAERRRPAKEQPLAL